MKKIKKTPQKAPESKKEIAKPKSNEAVLNEKKMPANRRSFLAKTKDMFEKAGLNPRKECVNYLLTFVLMLALCIATYLLLKNVLVLVAVIPFIMILTIAFFNKPKKILRKKREGMKEEFVRLLSFFRLFLNNGKSVYGAFEETRKYAKGDMMSLFDKLISEIDVDKTITPYLEFASAFDSMEIKQVMISAYELSLDGGKERFLHFDSIFGRISEEKRNESYDNLKNRLANLNFLPLIGSAFSMALVVVAIVVLMGGSTYGF